MALDVLITAGWSGVFGVQGKSIVKTYQLSKHTKLV